MFRKNWISKISFNQNETKFRDRIPGDANTQITKHKYNKEAL